MIRLHPRPTPQELPGYYPPSYWFEPGGDAAERLEELYRRIVLHDHVRFVRRALEAAGKTGVVLDVGCGGGLLLGMLARGGVKVAGLDFSLDAAEVAWRKQNVPAVCASLSHAPFAPGSCAVVTMFHVLEHLYDPNTYVQSAYELLQPGGRLVIQVPNASSWQFLLLGENWSGLDIPRHLLTFRVSDLEVLLDRCGFEPVRFKHFSLRDNPAGLATSLAPSLDPMARRVRGVREGPRKKLLKDLLYFCLAAACVPLTLLEAACRAGSTIMVEARKKS
ncbi:MAG TPA: class I SAM-dependent methyltransferase [Bryobacteraceae bacterium]|nr:class I SAM-dependent methyltransferase [Bryobacteraceae bacterium]